MLFLINIFENCNKLHSRNNLISNYKAIANLVGSKLIKSQSREWFAVFHINFGLAAPPSLCFLFNLNGHTSLPVLRLHIAFLLIELLLSTIKLHHVSLNPLTLPRNHAPRVSVFGTLCAHRALCAHSVRDASFRVYSPGLPLLVSPNRTSVRFWNRGANCCQSCLVYCSSQYS